jgi:hypothetical protein
MLISTMFSFRYEGRWLLAAAKMMPEAAVVVAPGWRVSAEMFS